MKTIIGYAVALALSLFNGKMVAGAISGILINPIVKPFERFSWVSRYLVPFVQGMAMGIVAVLTAEWLLSWFDLKMGWVMVALIVVGFVMIAGVLLGNAEERHFHFSAGLGELFGIFLLSYYFLQI